MTVINKQSSIANRAVKAVKELRAEAKYVLNALNRDQSASQAVVHMANLIVTCKVKRCVKGSTRRNGGYSYRYTYYIGDMSEKLTLSALLDIIEARANDQA